MKFVGHCNEYNFIRRNLVVHSKIWLNNSEALKQKILLLSAKFVCNVEICDKNCCSNKKNTYFVSQILVCNFAKKMRDSYSLVRRCKHTQKIHALNIRVLYHYVQ